MAKYSVYSTMSQDVRYADYARTTREQIPVVLRSVLIRGGANVAQKNLITPLGVVTEINDEEYALLEGKEGKEGNQVFKKHKEAGFIKVEKKKSSVEKVVKDMTGKDKSAQYKKEDFKQFTEAKVKEK